MFSVSATGQSVSLSTKKILYPNALNP